MHEIVLPRQRTRRVRTNAELAAVLTAALASAALVILLLSPYASATPDITTHNLNVPATADIFAAGMTSLPSMSGGAGTLPLSVGVHPGLPVRFPSVSGLVNPFSRGETEPYNGADGRTWGGTQIGSYGGISGISDEFQLMFLVGVFTDGTVPAAPAPSPLDFSEGSVGHAFETLSPQLGQVFFIGDGRAGLNDPSGALQTFVPPAGATTLFLGFADAWAFVGSPGWYGDNVGSLDVSVAVTVPYDWHGFFQPVDNPPTLNSVRAGSAVPVKFSLGGDKGLSIFAAGYPKSQVIACDSTLPLDAIESTVTAGGSSLTYDPSAEQYVYVWKTDKAWAGTCRQLVVQLADGSVHVANFKMQK